jgi:hypothetical protein
MATAWAPVTGSSCLMSGTVRPPRCHAETIEFIARKKAEGKTHREAVRSLKRHLVRRIWQLLRVPKPLSETAPHPSIP